MNRNQMDCNQPKLSIAIVTYNCLGDFQATLDNVVSQKYANKEIIVIDGGSTDGTKNYIEEKKHLIDQYLIESDTGPYDAMNKASRIAQGEWIIFINSGDTFASDIVCKKLLSEEISSFDILYGDHFYKDTNDQLFYIKSSEFKGIWNTLKTGRISNAWQESIPCHQATFIRTALLKETPYDLKFQIAADHDFLYKMCASGKRFRYIQEKVAIYSAGGMSQTKKWQCLFEWVDIASKHANPLIVRFYYLVFNPLKARVNRFYKIFSN